MAKWSRQTYEMVATGIQSQQKTDHGDDYVRDRVLHDLAYYFAGQFSADSHLFRRDQFLQACGITQAKGA